MTLILRQNCSSEKPTSHNGRAHDDDEEKKSLRLVGIELGVPLCYEADIYFLVAIIEFMSLSCFFGFGARALVCSLSLAL